MTDITKKLFEESMEHLAGTCMKSPLSSLEEVIQYSEANSPFKKVEVTELMVDEFADYLNENECYECEHCGWWTYPGEICDCSSEADYCENCGYSVDECECEDD